MKVKCIAITSGKAYATGLTIDKEYEATITSSGTGDFVVHNDFGRHSWYPNSWFIVLPPELSVTELAQEVHVKEVEALQAPDNNQQFKADAGKLRPSLLFDGMPNALLAVTAVLSYGAQKYEAHSWKGVDPARYEDAKERHNLARRAGERFDEESGLLHLAHEACNALFLLEQFFDNLPEGKEGIPAYFEFNAPPTGHKQ